MNTRQSRVPVHNDVPSDKMLELQELARRAQLLKSDIEMFEEQLASAKKEYNVLISEALPDAMDELSVATITYKDGNSSYALSMKNFYHASIEAAWEAERRKKAFDYLEGLGEGDLIKTEVTIRFDRGSRDDAIKFVERVKASGFAADVKENVHHMTLTSWLKNQVEDRQFVPDLSAIGATVGRKVKIEEK